MQEIERQAGFSFAEINKRGESDPLYINEHRLDVSTGRLWEVRAFLYNMVHVLELYAGDGYTYSTDGVRTSQEFFTLNRRLVDLADYRLIDVPYAIPLTALEREGAF